MNYEQKLTGAVIINQIALIYNEQLKETPFYSQKLKNKLNGIIPVLMKRERQYYDKIEDADDKNTCSLSGNVYELVKTLTDLDFLDMVIVGNIIKAHNKNPKAIEGIVNKILNK